MKNLGAKVQISLHPGLKSQSPYLNQPSLPSLQSRSEQGKNARETHTQLTLTKSFNLAALCW